MNTEKGLSRLSFRTLPHDDSFDYLIDGRSLHEMTCGKIKRELAGQFRRTTYAHNQRMIETMLTEGAEGLEDGWFPFFKCAHCGDIYCGGVLGKIEKTEGLYRWSQFSLDNLLPDDASSRISFDIGPFWFDPESYRKALESRAEFDPASVLRQPERHLDSLKSKALRFIKKGASFFGFFS